MQVPTSPRFALARKLGRHSRFLRTSATCWSGRYRSPKEKKHGPKETWAPGTRRWNGSSLAFKSLKTFWRLQSRWPAHRNNYFKLRLRMRSLMLGSSRCCVGLPEILSVVRTISRRTSSRAELDANKQHRITSFDRLNERTTQYQILSCRQSRTRQVGVPWQ